MGIEKTKKVRVRKLKASSIVAILLFLSFLSFAAFWYYSKPIKHIKILGTTNLEDTAIIEIAEIKNYPRFFKVSSNKLEKSITKLDLVDSVKVSKKLNGTLEIKVVENKVLFYNRSTNKAVLSNKQEVEMKASYIGIPTMVNVAPKMTYDKFIEGLSEVDYSIVGLISEIQYSRYTSADTVIDDTRFLLRMNDGNEVYVNNINLDKLNSYREIFASLEDGNRRIFLDSASSSVSIRDLIDEETAINEEENGEN